MSLDNTEQLMNYAELLNDEFGEYCIVLCNLYDHYDFVSQNEELLIALEEEIEHNLGYLKNSYKIVKSIQKYEQSVTELVEKNE